MSITTDDDFLLFTDSSTPGDLSKDVIAGLFDNNKVYKKGELCWRNDQLWQSQQNTGPGFVNADWVEVNVSDAIYPAKINKIISNNEYSYALTDADDKLLFGIKTDGTVYFQKIHLEELGELQTQLDNKVDKETNKGLIDVRFANGISFTSNEEYIFAVIDANQKFLFGVKNNGEFDFAKGIPFPIRKELEQK